MMAEEQEQESSPDPDITINNIYKEEADGCHCIGSGVNTGSRLFQILDPDQTKIRRSGSAVRSKKYLLGPVLPICT